MAKKIFERIEKKYLVPKSKYEELMQEINKHMILDAYRKHTISNIYFDTGNFYLIRHSLEKPLYKEKLRLRAYGLLNEERDVFNKYTRRAELQKVRTINMGSLYELHYLITEKNVKKEKAMLDDIRIRNGNLNIICSKPGAENNQL